MTMTTSRTQIQAQALVLPAVVVAARPSAHLKMIPEGRNRHEQTTQPQQGLGKAAECLQHLKRTLGGSKRRRHILGVLGQGIHLYLDSDKPVVDFAVGYVFRHSILVSTKLLQIIRNRAKDNIDKNSNGEKPNHYQPIATTSAARSG
jgi:hypothetical protein